MSLQAEQPVLVRTRTADSLAWMRFDAGVRLVPFGLLVLLVWLAGRPTWLGLGVGDARAPVAGGRDPRPLRSDLRLSRPGPVAAEAPRPALTDGPRWSVLALAGVATFFVSFDGSVMILALPAIAADFGASVPAIADLGSIFGLGTIAGLPIAMLADRRGRRRLLALAVAGFSVANLASAAAPGLWWLAGFRAVAVT